MSDSPVGDAQLIARVLVQDDRHAFGELVRRKVRGLDALLPIARIRWMDQVVDESLTRQRFNAELLSIWQTKQQTVIFVTHDLSEAITLADRIVVMTRRPGRIKLIYDVKLPRPRDVIKLRESEEYLREYAEIWHALGEEMKERA